jgi:hypothetical protein
MYNDTICKAFAVSRKACIYVRITNLQIEAVEVVIYFAWKKVHIISIMISENKHNLIVCWQ